MLRVQCLFVLILSPTLVTGDCSTRSFPPTQYPYLALPSSPSLLTYLDFFCHTSQDTAVRTVSNMASTGATSDWATYLAGATPCRFPMFNRAEHHTATGLPQIGSALVVVEQEDKLLALSTKNVDGLSAVLRTAWALLLQCYTGQDDVSFGFELGADHGDGPTVARFRLDGSASVGRTVARAKTEIAGRLAPVPAALLRSGDSDQLLFDTAVVLWNCTQSSAPIPVLTPVTDSPLLCDANSTLTLIKRDDTDTSCSSTSFVFWQSAGRPTWACSLNGPAAWLACRRRRPRW